MLIAELRLRDEESALPSQVERDGGLPPVHRLAPGVQVHDDAWSRLGGILGGG